MDDGDKFMFDSRNQLHANFSAGHVIDAKKVLVKIDRGSRQQTKIAVEGTCMMFIKLKTMAEATRKRIATGQTPQAIKERCASNAALAAQYELRLLNATTFSPDQKQAHERHVVVGAIEIMQVAEEPPRTHTHKHTFHLRTCSSLR